MSKEFQEHVFDSFARERTVTESGITGTGLGMAITKNIVDLMGGTIHLTSKQGEGSEFIVTLECELANKTVQDKQSSCPKAEKKHLDYSGKKVLLVEDNELNREIATEILKSLGMKVDCAADGMEAVEIMSSEAGNQYDLIFMDAAKGQYIHWLPDIVRLLAPGGILLSDNVLQEGELIESHYLVERRNRTIYKRMREYLYELKHHPQLLTSIVPLGDGISLSVKQERGNYEKN